MSCLDLESRDLALYWLQKEPRKWAHWPERGSSPGPGGPTLRTWFHQEEKNGHQSLQRYIIVIQQPQGQGSFILNLKIGLIGQVLVTCSSLKQLVFPEAWDTLIGQAWVTCSSLNQLFYPEEWNTLIGQAWVTCSLRAELGGRGGGRVKVNLWWRFLKGHLTSCSQKGK